MQILFITANRVGDAILATGLLAHLVEQYPNAEFTIASGPVSSGLYRAVPRLKKTILLKKQPHHTHWLNFWRECRQTKWDLIVDLRNSLASRLLPAKQRAYRPAMPTGKHKVIDNAVALALNPPPSPKIWLDDAAKKAAASILLETDLPFLALGPAANWPAKQWSNYNFAKLAERLTAAHGLLPQSKILLVAGDNEREQIVPLLEMLPAEQVVEVIGHDLLTVAACLQRCRLFIGNDSGLMHMSAAVGTPTLGLFGPSLETIFGPWGQHTTALRTVEKPEELFQKMPYSGSFYPNLMGGLSPQMAYQAAVELFERTQRR